MSGLTPSQALLVDLLIARYHLGNAEWPIQNDMRRTIYALEVKGYITHRPGPAKNTQLVRLTEQAVRELTQRGVIDKKPEYSSSDSRA